MDSLQATYRDEDDEEDESAHRTTTERTTPPPPPPQPTTSTSTSTETEPQNDTKQDPNTSTDSLSDDEPASPDTQEPPKPTLNDTPINENENENDDDEEDDDDDPPPKKQKPLSSLTPQLPNNSPPPHPPSPPINATPAPPPPTAKKSKKKNNNVWVTKSTRKGKKKNKSNNNHNTPAEDTVLITPVQKFPDKSDDTPDLKICLSKIYKAEKVELSDDRLTAGSSKGYRMVRATRGVIEGAWYYEIRIVRLGETGHTRLGWSTEKGDLQAPVGYDANSFGYRDIDGSKVHKALREKYGEEGYKEGDVIGFYINLPEGDLYAPKPPHLVLYKGQRYACAPDTKEEAPKVVPGSEISFFKNGVCQGVAFKDLYGGRFYPAASMYTLPNQPNCLVKFNFGPDFEFFPEDFNGHSVPRPMVEVPYHGFDNKVENGVSGEKKQQPASGTLQP